MNRNYFIQYSLISFSAAFLSGCMTVGPDYVAPELASYQDAWIAGDVDVLAPGAVADTDWWMDFNDPVMVRLIDAASTGNFDIAQAASGVAAAQAGLDRAYTLARFPGGGLSGAVTRQKQSSASFGADLPFEFEAQTTYSTGASGSWESGLFGRIESGLTRAQAALGSQEAILADTRRAIIAQTAITYLTLRELNQRISVSEDNLDRQTEVLRLTRQLKDAGEVSDLDVERQTNLVETTRAGQLALKSAREETLAALALLSGQTLPDFLADFPELTPETSTDYSTTLQAFSPLRISSPEDMLRRRPDIRAAERQYANAIALVQFTTADLYPQLTLTGNLSLTALEPGELFSGDAFGYSFGPRLSWDVFSIPSTKLEIAQREAEAEATRLALERTIIGALTETDAALQTYNLSVEQAAISRRALGSAERSRDLVEIRYREGAESLLSLIEAQRQALAAQDSELQTRFEAMRRRVEVYRALGG
tara:strand:+ start:6131 stop:7573 length:1443 start_codon:yes stop_codon:yes gene_type:complete